MKVNLELGNTDLRFWFLIHRTRDALKICEERIFAKHGLSSEQYAVLVTMKYLGNPTRPSYVAKWLERSTNSVSVILDHMVKGGLIKRVRDKRDRRVVRLTITSKGENALKPATLAGLEFIHRVVSPLSIEERHTLVTLLETLKHEALKYGNPGEITEEARTGEASRRADLMKRLVEYTSSSTSETRRQGGKQGETV